MSAALRPRCARWARFLAVAAATGFPLIWPAGAEAGPAKAADRAEPADSPPVLLRKRLLLTPEETAGTGLAPEVRVRIRVDRQGRVSDVEVPSITPSSEYDDLFRRTVVDTLESWRYAPARSEGEPVETTLEWTIQFLRRPTRSAGGSAGLDPVLDDPTRHARVFTLPREQQAELLQHLAGLAEPQLDRASRRRADSPRFVVISDASDAATAETVASNLEAVYGLLDETFRPEIELQPAHYKLVVYLFRTRDAFSRLTAQVESPEWAEGLYMPPGLFAFHLEAGSVDTLLGTLIHEAVHAYTDQHLVRPGLRPPPWLVEGLAHYFGLSEVRKGRLVPGSIREGKYVIDQRLSGAYRRTTDTGWSLDRLQRAVRTGEAVGAATLFSLGPEAFYGDDKDLHYAMSWLLVHFLRHGEPGWSGEEFPTLLLYVAEGYPAAAALETVYGLSPADLEEPLRAYVKGL
jgi:TonB family protein